MFLFLFTASVYNIIPWSYVAQQAMEKDITAPGLLSYVLPKGLDTLIILGAAIALVNDLPAMLLSVSRLTFAWAKDGIVFSKLALIHPKNNSPVVALICAGVLSSIGVLGSNFAGDFFRNRHYGYFHVDQFLVDVHNSFNYKETQFSVVF